MGVPVGAEFWSAFLRGEIDVDCAEPSLVAFFPLEVVEERPKEISFNWCAGCDGAVEFA
jgi:hypothetical protein